MLDLKNWFNPKHYKRLWNVGPPGLIASLLLIYLTLQYEEALNIKKYETKDYSRYVIIDEMNNYSHLFAKSMSSFRKLISTSIPSRILIN